MSKSNRSASPLPAFGRAVFALFLVVLAMPALAQGAAGAAKAFFRDDLAASAAAIEDKIKRDIAAPAKPDIARLAREGEAALAKGDARAALALGNQLARLAPQASSSWRLIARAARAIPPKDWGERYELAERASAAAYLAYQRASGKAEEAGALALLAQIFEWREMWRPALTAYRLSLESAENAAIRKAYEHLRETRGFRLADYTIEADLAAPRACFTFTEPLARGRIDFAPYVAITGKGDFAVEAEDSRLCVQGLKHGERYAIVLRQGIPSAVDGESLLKSADYEIYVRDRTPSVRTSGRTYVLPSSGQQGIPLISVNTDTIGLRVFRIGDRNLINTVRGPEFLEQLEAQQIDTILNESGQRVWQGTLSAKSELNREIVTAFPVLEAAGRLEPGLYGLVAQAGAFKAEGAPQLDGEAAPLATQWFVVSDLGLTTFSAGDGVHVLVRSLASAGPIAAARIRLIAKNNEVLGEVRTDAEGHARFDPGLSRGEGGLAPGLITAELAGDYGFLSLQQAAFDLSDRGVAGRIAPKGLDAYVYAERGVYRPGETVHLTALLRDAAGQAVTGLPLTLLAKRPDGVEYRRVILEDQGGGGRALSLALVSGAPLGTWRVAVFSDPKRAAIGETTFLVEDYVPERLDLVLEAKSPTIPAGGQAEINASVRYLYGAPAADLTISGETIIRRAAQSALPGFAGYHIGIEDEPVEANRAEIETRPNTDAKGEARLVLPVKAPETSLPLEMEISLTASETGGRGVTRSLVLPILPQGAVIGVKPLFEEGSLNEGETARFAVILANGAGKRLAQAGLKWQLARVNRHYQWFFKDGRWAYEAIKTVRRIADGSLATSATEPAELAAKIGWGTYRLEIRSESGAPAATAFDFAVGYGAEAKADSPDVLDLTLDKKAYADGEMMQVRLSPRFAGSASLAVMSDRLTLLKRIDLPAEGALVSIPVSKDWGPGAYLVALAHRPLDAAAQRMPGRAIGLAWFAIGPEARKLALDLGAPKQIRPRGRLDLDLRLPGLAPGEEAHVTVAAVDIGILNLTRYAAPNPSAYFFGQRQLSAQLRDLYGYLIDGMQGIRGEIRSGGDAAPSTRGEKPTQEPLARFSGIVKVNPDGTAPISFDIPAFNGAIRVMAVAWSRERTSEASADILVRDPIVVQASVPRFLGIGDSSRVTLEINNVDGAAGEYTLDLAASGPLTLDFTAAQGRIQLEKGQKRVLNVPLRGTGLGLGRLDISLSGGGERFAQSLALPVKAFGQTQVSRIVRPLAPGQTLTLSNALIADMVPGTGAVALTAAPYGALDVPALLAALDRYPYGCTEQTISRAMPLLYVNKLASLEALAIDEPAETRLTHAIERVLARQDASGAFGLWGIGGADLWLDAFVGDFLTRAREHNFAVPNAGFSLLLDRLRNRVANVGEINAEEASAIAYAIYVLARNGRPMMGDLRYLVDNKLEDFASPLAKGQLGASLALLGDRGRARLAFDAAEKSLAGFTEDGVFRADYGSKLRDAAGLLALLAEGKAEPAELRRVATALDQARQARKFTSTQEQLWMVIAAEALAKEAQNFQLELDGVAQTGPLYRNLSQAALDRAPLALRNLASSEARVVLGISGIPLSPAPAIDEGFMLTRQVFTLAGTPVAPDAYKQNDRYVVKLEISQKAARAGRLLLVDPLPAGLEIENAQLTAGASLEGLAFLGELAASATIEARDDRFVAAFERGAEDAATFRIAYIVRAVSPGRFTQAAAQIEDMYRPDRFGRTGFGQVSIGAPAPARP